MLEQQEDVVIYDSSLTLDQLKHMWCYMDEEGAVEFTGAELDQLADDIDDAIRSTIEHFLSHRNSAPVQQNDERGKK